MAPRLTTAMSHIAIAEALDGKASTGWRRSGRAVWEVTSGRIRTLRHQFRHTHRAGSYFPSDQLAPHTREVLGCLAVNPGEIGLEPDLVSRRELQHRCELHRDHTFGKRFGLDGPWATGRCSFEQMRSHTGGKIGAVLMLGEARADDVGSGLRRRWRGGRASPHPNTSPGLFCSARRVQAKAFGDLDRATVRLLDQLARRKPSAAQDLAGEMAQQAIITACLMGMLRGYAAVSAFAGLQGVSTLAQDRGAQDGTREPGLNRADHESGGHLQPALAGLAAKPSTLSSRLIGGWRPRAVCGRGCCSGRARGAGGSARASSGRGAHRPIRAGWSG